MKKILQLREKLHQRHHITENPNKSTTTVLKTTIKTVKDHHTDKIYQKRKKKIHED